MQIHSWQEFEPSKADGGPPCLREGDHWQKKDPRHSLSYYFIKDWLISVTPDGVTNQNEDCHYWNANSSYDVKDIQPKLKPRQTQNMVLGMQKWRVN
jgi:hypothetical protein